MIVDVELRYPVDFVPKRGRKVRRGHRAETIPLEVRERTSVEAPAAFAVGRGAARRIVRECEGLLYEREGTAGGRDVHPQLPIRALADRSPLKEALLRTETRLRDVFGDGDEIRMSSRDFSVARLKEFVDDEILLVDGTVHRRVRSPVVDLEIVAMLGDDRARAAVDAAGGGFAACWFLPGDGAVLAGVMHIVNFERGHPVRAGRLIDARDDMHVEILDPDAYARAAGDPANVAVRRVAIEMVEHRLTIIPDLWLSEMRSASEDLMGAFARSEVPYVSSMSELDAKVREAAGRWHVGIRSGGGAAGSAPVRPMREFGRRHVVSIDKEGHNKTGTMIPRNLPMVDHSVAFVFDRSDEVSDFEWSVRRPGWGRRHPPEELAVPEDGFDVDLWNARAAMHSVLVRLGCEVHLLSRGELAILARMHRMIDDWRDMPIPDPDPVVEAAFLEDAEAVVRMLDGHVLGDVVPDWVGVIAWKSIGALRTRLENERAVPDADEFADLRM